MTKKIFYADKRVSPFQTQASQQRLTTKHPDPLLQFQSRQESPKIRLILNRRRSIFVAQRAQPHPLPTALTRDTRSLICRHLARGAHFIHASAETSTRSGPIRASFARSLACIAARQSLGNLSRARGPVRARASRDLCDSPNYKVQWRAGLPHADADGRAICSAFSRARARPKPREREREIDTIR